MEVREVKPAPLYPDLSLPADNFLNGGGGGSKEVVKLSQQGLTNSFFYHLHSQIDRLHLPPNPQQQRQTPTRVESNQVLTSHGLLKELNSHLKQMGLKQGDQESSVFMASHLSDSKSNLEVGSVVPKLN